MAIADVLFLPWPHWAQLTFVLGGLMIIVGCFASIMKLRNWRKTIKFERQSAVEQAERGEMVQATPVKEEIPFGVKALDEEPAIEGVWNARTVTSLHIPPGSRGTSPRFGPSRFWQKSKRGSSVSSISRLDVEEPVQTAPLPVPASAPENTQNDAVPIPSTRRKKANSITINYAGPSVRAKDESRCPLCDTDSTGLLVSGDSEASQHKLRLQTPPRRAGSLRRRFVIGGRSSPHTSETYLQDDNRSAIERMDAHRKLHSAECGQLLPRARRHTTEISDGVEDRAATYDKPEPPRIASWPTRTNSVRLGPKLPQKAERRVSPPAVSQRASIENHPLPNTCPSAWTNRTQDLVTEKLSENWPLHLSQSSTLPSMTSSTTLSTITGPIEPASIPSTRTRKINEGFEVLPAGTFEREPSFKILGLWPAPIADRTNAGKKPNKLQKRSRSGSASSTSSFGSQKTDEQKSENIRLRHSVY